MTKETSHWTKTELQVYILLLSANADKDETNDELEMIKSKVELQTFLKIYQEFQADSEEERLQKIDTNIHLHTYSSMELIEFRTEVHRIFLSDHNFSMLEKRLDWTLDNILY